MTPPRGALGGAIALTCLVLLACNPTGPESNPSETSFGDSTPRFSPDGTHVVFVRAQGGDSDIYVMDLEGGRARLLVSASQYDVDPVLSPDGSEILFDTSPDGYPQLHLVPVAGGDIQPISGVLDGWATFPAWAPDGETIVYACGRPSYPRSDLCLLTPTGEFLGLLGHESESQELEPSWSPDGTTVAFASNRSGNQDVYLIDVKSGRVRRITEDPSHDADPSWSPDGKMIAFTSDRDGTAHVCLMLVDGSNVRCLTEGVQPSWSPDGRSIAFYRTTAEGTRIFLVRVDGAGLTQIT